MKLVVNIVAFKLGWLACVFGAGLGKPWLGPLVVSFAVGVHLYLAERPTQEVLLITAAAIIGLLWDSAMVRLGWLSYPNGTFIAGLAPYWIVAMWALFATTLNVMWRRLHGKHLIAFLLGAAFGPLSYVAGAKLGAVTFLQPNTALFGLAVAWALFFPGLLALAQRLNTIEANPREVSTRA